MEQKNASVVREYFGGYERVDRLERTRVMDVPCAKISLYEKPATPLDRATVLQNAGPEWR